MRSRNPQSQIRNRIPVVQRNATICSRLTSAAPILSGVMLACSFPPLCQGWMAWFALVPLALCLRRDTLTRSDYIGVYIGGLTFALAAFLWLPGCNYQNAPWGPFTLAWLVTGHLGGTLLAVTVWAGRRFVSWSRWPLALCLPIIWLGFELAGSALGLLLAQTTVPFIQLGITQADYLIVVQFADILGAPGVTVFVCAVNGLLADAVAERVSWRAIRVAVTHDTAAIAHDNPADVHDTNAMPLRHIAAAIVATMATIAVLGYGVWRLEQKASETGPSVCLMRENDLPPFAPGHPLTDTKNVPDLLVWSEEVYHYPILDQAPTSAGQSQPVARIEPTPERLAPTQQETLQFALLQRPSVQTKTISVRPGSQPRDRTAAQDALTDSARTVGAALLIGCRRVESVAGGERLFNSLALATPRDGYVGHWDKRHLVPWTEFTPYAPPSSSDRQAARFTAGVPTDTFVIHSKTTGQDYRFRCAICYDICFPEALRNTSAPERRKPADFLVQVGSEVQDRSGFLRTTMFRMARLRAIEFRTSILRNVTGSLSGVFDGAGRFVAIEPGAIGGSIRGSKIGPPTSATPSASFVVPLDRREGLYATWGDAPLLSAWTLLVAFPISRRLVSRKSRSRKNKR